MESKDGDSQTRGFTRVFMAGAYNGKDYKCWTGAECIDKMMRAILKKKYRGQHIYAHNGGKFDYLHLLPWVISTGQQLGFSFEITPIASGIQMLDIKDESGSVWRFLDSLKLIPIALKKAAKAFKVIQKLDDHDLDLDESDPAWRTYNERDCHTLYQVLHRFHELVEDYLKGEVGVTTASTSMRTFRRVYQKIPIMRHVETQAFVREGYYGGRVEVYQQKAKNLRYYDINSCYPFAMLEPMPCGVATKWEGVPPTLLTRDQVGFCRAKVEVPAWLNIPPLPYRGKDKLLFPTGRFTGVWDWAELKDALEQGVRVLEWHDSVWYEAKPLFNDMVNALFEFRDTSRPDYDEGLAFVAKIILNSLYGKFGMRHERKKIYPNKDAPLGSHPVIPGDFDCPVYYHDEMVDAQYIIPQISAHVTALARIGLGKYIREARNRDGVVAYVDTDALITTADLSDLVGPELGKLKDEGKGVTYEGLFVQPKLYALHGSDGSSKYVMKGFAERSAEIFNRILAGDTIEFKLLEKLGGMARKGFASGPTMRLIKKTIKQKDSKRIFAADGSSEPIWIEEDEAAKAAE